MFIHPDELRVIQYNLRKQRPYRFLFLKILRKIEDIVFINQPLSKVCECSFTELAHFDKNYEFDIEDFPCHEFKERTNGR